MNVTQLHEFYNKNWSHMSRELNLGKNTYQTWVRNGYIPIPTQIKIEKATKGKLKADLGR